MSENKYLEEIEAILSRAEGAGARPLHRQAFRLLRMPSWARLPRLRIGSALSPGRLMVAGVAALVLAMVLRSFFSWLMVPLLWAGLGLFILAYLLFLVQPRVPRYEKRWRGRLIEEEESLWKRIRRKLRRM